MQTKLSSLLELQKIDLRLKELEGLRGDLPQKVDDIRLKLNELSDSLNRMTRELKETETEHRNSSLELEQAKSRLAKYQDQLFRVSTNKEYDAITMEIDSVKADIDNFELRILELGERQEKLQEEIKNTEEQQATQTANLEALEKELQEKLNITNREEQNLRIRRQEIVSKIDRPMYGTYERVRKGKNGVAVVATQRGACGGCFNAIPPQRLLEIREKNKFITCEFCGRIIVWDEQKNQE